MKLARELLGLTLFVWVVMVHLLAAATLPDIIEQRGSFAGMAVATPLSDGDRAVIVATIIVPPLVLWLALGGWRAIAAFFGKPERRQ